MAKPGLGVKSPLDSSRRKTEHGTSDIKAMNIEHSSSNLERRSDRSPVYDLEERLLDYAVRIIRLVEALPNTRAGNHVAGQLLRSGTSALPNHGEAQAAVSRADFIHKMKVCLKELRETLRWLKVVQGVPLVTPVAPLGTVVS